jgi:phage baseplate assembly protein W
MTERAISLPFSFDSSGGISFTTDDKKIWQDRVALVVMTLLNERVMRPGFGTNAKGVAFENISDAVALIKQEVTIGFATWLRDLKLIDVICSTDKDQAYLTAEVTYSKGINDSIAETVSFKTAILNRSGETILEVTNG